MPPEADAPTAEQKGRQEMQTSMNNARKFVADLFRRMASWQAGQADRWDRVSLCSMAPISAGFVRDQEEAERRHHSW